MDAFTTLYNDFLANVKSLRHPPEDPMYDFVDLIHCYYDEILNGEYDCGYDWDPDDVCKALGEIQRRNQETPGWFSKPAIPSFTGSPFVSTDDDGNW